MLAFGQKRTREGEGLADEEEAPACGDTPV
jgi:hypothetical protein